MQMTDAVRDGGFKVLRSDGQLLGETGSWDQACQWAFEAQTSTGIKHMVQPCNQVTVTVDLEGHVSLA